jgi:hypothetical protein
MGRVAPIEWVTWALTGAKKTKKRIVARRFLNKGFEFIGD